MMVNYYNSARGCCSKVNPSIVFTDIWDMVQPLVEVNHGSTEKRNLM